jgi:hypothetical protein
MHVNVVFGWSSILAGMVGGMALGMGFHREDWLGGYSSHTRRLLRLGHISLIALGVLNVLFSQLPAGLAARHGGFGLASVAFITGGVSMPLCCGLMAWRRGLQPLFAVPVSSLLLGTGIVVAALLRP